MLIPFFSIINSFFRVLSFNFVVFLFIISFKFDNIRYRESAPGNIEWHVNFADAQLFGFFEGSLFAQDEMQVREREREKRREQKGEAEGADGGRREWGRRK